MSLNEKNGWGDTINRDGLFLSVFLANIRFEG